MKYGTTLGPFVDRIEESANEFAFVEIALGPGGVRLADLDIKNISDRLEAADLDLTVHLPGRLPLATTIPEYDEASRQYASRLLDAAAELGAEKAVLHATASNPNNDEHLTVVRSQLTSIAEIGTTRDVEVVVENVGQLETGVGLDELTQIADNLELSVCFDVGHAFLECGQTKTKEFLDKFGRQVSHVHLHDVRSRGDTHLPVGAGELTYEPLARSLTEVGFDETIAVEVFTDDLPLIRDSATRFSSLLK